MTREQKIQRLLARGDDDSRLLGLDRLDEQARATDSWGSQEHRQARDKIERTYDASRAALDKLSDEQLDRALAAGQPAS